MARKGILLAGGSGSRLDPLTRAISKQLLPVYDKPMVYYPLTTLMQAGIREVLLISTARDLPRFRDLLGDGGAFGIRLAYAVQPRPEGLAQALIIAEEFLDGAPSALILGDNLFLGRGMEEPMRAAAARPGAGIFTLPVADPERFGILALDASGVPVAIEEKPPRPASNLAVVGLYFYDAEAPARARRLAPSPRGELEITDLNRLYLDEGRLQAAPVPPGIAWFDAGTVRSLLTASNRVAALAAEGVLTGSPEACAFEQGWIDADALRDAAEMASNSSYGVALQRLLA